MAALLQPHVQVEPGVEEGDFQVTVPHCLNVPIFYDILQKISVMLQTTKSNPAINQYKPSVVTFKGSVAQVPYLMRSNDYGNNESGMQLS